MSRGAVLYEADDVHEEAREGVSIEHDDEDLLHCLDLCVLAALLEGVAQGVDVVGVVAARVLPVHNRPCRRRCHLLSARRHGARASFGRRGWWWWEWGGQ